MKAEQEGYKHSWEVMKAQADAKLVSKYMKRKIPGELRTKWYVELVVPALQEYNQRCRIWLKENVK